MREVRPVVLSRDLLPWLAGALLVLLAVIAALWLTAPEENLLPRSYDVM